MCRFQYTETRTTAKNDNRKIISTLRWRV